MRRSLGSTAALLFVMAVLSACSGNNSQKSANPVPSSVSDLQGNTVATKPRPASSESWDEVRPGVKVYTGDDGGSASTLTVCSTLASYVAFMSDDNAANCSHEKRGVLAVVEQVIPAKSNTDTGSFAGAPNVRIRAADGSWSGYTTVVSLQPMLPVGTVIVMKRMGNAVLNLAPRQASDLNVGPDLGDKVTVRVLHYYPDTADRSLYVNVLDGKYAGQNGWMFAMDAQTLDGKPVASLDYQIATPAPTTDPMSRTYTLTSPLRVFSDLDVCKAAFHAMEDDAAYQQLKDAVANGRYHDFDTGEKLHILSDPDSNDLWVIVADDNGNQGCASRYNLPGY